jgi:hypothetical protein
MFENLYYKIGLKWCLFRFRKKKDMVQNFTSFIQSGDNILLIMPNDPKQFDEAKEVIIKLPDIWGKVNLALVVKSQYSTAYNELRDNFRTYGILSSDINRFFLPRKKIKQEILRIPYDITIDLNLDLHLASAFLSKATEAKYRIGIKKEMADFFYNFQFDPIDYNNLKKIYNNLFNNLRMFGNLGEKNEIQSR